MAREQNRDISEKVALGLAKPTQSSETMWDSRLFNQTSGMQAGFNEDNPYDKPLFAAQDAINSIYRPRAQADADDEDAGEGEMSKLEKTNRFEVLGRAKEGFRGAADAEVGFSPIGILFIANMFFYRSVKALFNSKKTLPIHSALTT